MGHINSAGYFTLFQRFKKKNMQLFGQTFKNAHLF